jgi:hypothetical protein
MAFLKGKSVLQQELGLLIQEQKMKSVFSMAPQKKPVRLAWTLVLLQISLNGNHCSLSAATSASITSSA